MLYTPERLAKIGAEAAKGGSVFNLDDRLGLVYDSFALSRAGFAKLSATLHLIDLLRNEPECKSCIPFSIASTIRPCSPLQYLILRRCLTRVHRSCLVFDCRQHGCFVLYLVGVSGNPEESGCLDQSKLSNASYLAVLLTLLSSRFLSPLLSASVTNEPIAIPPMRSNCAQLPSSKPHPQETRGTPLSLPIHALMI